MNCLWDREGYGKQSKSLRNTGKMAFLLEEMVTGGRTCSVVVLRRGESCYVGAKKLAESVCSLLLLV